MRLILYILFFLLSVSTACADIKIGSVYYYPPFVINKYQGFDIELMNNLCQRMQVKCTLVQMDGRKLFPALQNRTIQLAIGGILLSPQREENFLFSIPYLQSRAVFLVPKKSNLKQISDLKGKSVGASNNLSGTIFIDYLQANFHNEFQIKSYATTEALIDDLEKGSLSAAFVHESSANYWKENGMAWFRVLGEPRIVGDGVGIVALPEQQDLINTINQNLQYFEKNGTYLNLYKTYFGMDYLPQNQNQ